MYFKVNYKDIFSDVFYYVKMTDLTVDGIRGDFVVDKPEYLDIVYTGGYWSLKSLQTFEMITDKELVTKLNKIFKNS